ncbi:hypothetical protein DRW41_19705 [Neobacillus piezotolerans]|uniref:Uncharacterized protein n=1 Tax=Neobacillus piezotolerans TaxID=2259171 RepID=A0A3D8GLG8_9BACI|nr:hypothetical protein [Neobacillus piezotolerans]RDU35172.1 hypothetical protein DRW41_19705 [Neobacillus piezotolerans]
MIGAEGADSSKTLTRFLRAWANSKMPFSVLREKLARGDPAGMCLAEEAAGLPAESEAPVA